jgi:hypothetical protein
VGQNGYTVLNSWVTIPNNAIFKIRSGMAVIRVDGGEQQTTYYLILVRILILAGEVVNRRKVRLFDQERTRFHAGKGFFYGGQFRVLELE